LDFFLYLSSSHETQFLWIKFGNLSDFSQLFAIFKGDFFFFFLSGVLAHIRLFKIRTVESGFTNFRVQHKSKVSHVVKLKTKNKKKKWHQLTKARNCKYTIKRLPFNIPPKQKTFFLCLHSKIIPTFPTTANLSSHICYEGNIVYYWFLFTLNFHYMFPFQKR